MCRKQDEDAQINLLTPNNFRCLQGRVYSLDGNKSRRILDRQFDNIDDTMSQYRHKHNMHQQKWFSHFQCASHSFAAVATDITISIVFYVLFYTSIYVHFQTLLYPHFYDYSTSILYMHLILILVRNLIRVFHTLFIMTYICIVYSCVQ